MEKNHDKQVKKNYHSKININVYSRVSQDQQASLIDWRKMKLHWKYGAPHPHSIPALIPYSSSDSDSPEPTDSNTTPYPLNFSRRSLASTADPSPSPSSCSVSGAKIPTRLQIPIYLVFRNYPQVMLLYLIAGISGDLQRGCCFSGERELSSPTEEMLTRTMKARMILDLNLFLFGTNSIKSRISLISVSQIHFVRRLRRMILIQPPV